MWESPEDERTRREKTPEETHEREENTRKKGTEPTPPEENKAKDTSGDDSIQIRAPPLQQH